MTPLQNAALLDLTHAGSIEELWDLHCRRMASFGFDRLLYGFTRFRTATSLGDPNDFIILSNIDSDYVSQFIHNGLYRHAPMVRWAVDNDGAASWTVLQMMMDSGTVTEPEKRILEFNAKHQITAGFSISFRSLSDRAKGAIALIAEPGMAQRDVDAMWDTSGELIQLMNNIVHLKILTLPYTPPNQALTKRQREALEWVGGGKTMQDIATIMGLTTATVEKHLRLARVALNVDTTAQAVLKAALQNQMFVSDG
ncbi:LuxR family transcriptional regulator [Marivita sp. S6314]|uniref:LuxR family transcriptional regulator n=1 Tax=Marivita sp. S6314 TaxID=2926406 RepID=UPI001FF3BBF8|nr:LuxR family transcriptional regulator [Marivita sp. S6314]MCK0148521.1 LuxR family transcriptional regulator [Marivita sp. S6314]